MYKKFIFCIFFVVIFCISASFVSSVQGAPGVSVQIPGDIYGQPKVIEDIDGDGVRDIIFGATDGKVHIVSAGTGEEIFRPPFWPKQTGGPILADIKLADIDGDGAGTEVIVASQDGKVYCLNSLGREVWVHDTRGKILISAPEIADIEGNGVLNLLIGSESGTVSRLSPKGELIWEVRQANSVSAAVVARDLTFSGQKEIIVKDDNGNVVVYSQNGVPLNGWPKRTAPNGIWPFNVDANDVLGDGTLQVFTTTPSKKFIMWGVDGTTITEFSISDGAHNAPVVADINGDGRDNIIIAQADGTVTVTDIEGKSLPGWPFTTGHAIYSSPKIIDLNGSGMPDIVFTAWDPLGEDEQAGYIMALSHQGIPLEGYPIYIGKTVAPLTFADLDGDGFLEMIAAGGINYTAKQLYIIPTKARSKIKMAVLAQEVRFE